MKGLSKASKNAVIAVMIISLVLMMGSMTAPLLEYIRISYADTIAPGTEYLILTIPALVGMLAAFAIGPLAMKINIKYLLLVCGTCAAIYFGLFAFVGFTNGPFSLLLVAAGIVGITQGASMVLTSSIFSMYVTDPAQRANFVAIAGAFMNGGGAVANVLGGIIAAGNGGANWPYAYVLGLLIVPAIIAFWIFMPKQPDAVEDAGGPGGGHGGPGGPGGPAPSGFIPVQSWAIIILILVMFVGFAGFVLNVGLYIAGELAPLGYTSVEAGLVNSINTILGVVAGFTYPLFAKFLKKWIVIFGFVVAGLGIFLIAFFQTPVIGLYLGGACVGLGFNLAMPYAAATLMTITPGRWVPITFSIYMGGANLAMFLAPYILGPLSGALMGGSIQGQVIIGGIIFAVCIIPAVFIFIFWKSKTAAAPAEG